MLPPGRRAAARLSRGPHQSGGRGAGLGHLDEAVTCHRRALDLQPDYPLAHANLGVALQAQGRLDQAVASTRRSLALAPDTAATHFNLGSALKEQGHLDEAVTCYRTALTLRPDYAEAYSNLLFTLNYMSGAPALDEARRFGRMVSAKAIAPFTAWDCPAGRLRVGLVSGDLHAHPVGYFLEGVLAALDLELFAYPTREVEDQVSRRLRHHVAAWTPLAGLDDQAAAARIHADGVHVLIDLSGHTAHNRLPVFAWRPAPVQVTWLGYFATTGMAEIDYVLADPHMVPPGEEGHFTERVWRLPDSHWCFTPPDDAPEVGPLPALASGSITFGCFNTLTKINDRVVALWMRVLAAVPGSRLLLKARQLGEESVRQATRFRFGPLADRLILEGPSPRADMLKDYQRVDVALDPFPFPGGTTTLEGLWMGVPVLTRRGDRFVSHQGESIAINAGLAEWIAADDDDTVAKAAALDLHRLAEVRAGLRSRMRTSPLFDAPRFARHLEAALGEMVKARERGRPANIS